MIVQQLRPALRTHLQLSADPRLAPVAAILNRWNQQRLDGNTDGRYDDPAVTIFNAWYSIFSADIVTKTLGADYGVGQVDENTTANVALRLLGGSPDLPLAANYLQDTPLDTAVTGSLVASLDRLTADYGTGDTAAWLTSAATTTWTPPGVRRRVIVMGAPSGSASRRSSSSPPRSRRPSVPALISSGPGPWCRA